VSSTEAPEVDPGPFDLPGNGDAAALCLHGLSGTPYEVRALGEALSACGMRAVGPVLPGHGGGAALLRRTGHAAWIEAARGHLRALRREHEVVCGVGLSMGGLVTLHLAAEGAYEAVACVGVPLALHQPGTRWVRFFKYLMPDLPKRGGSDICDPVARARHPSLPVMPLAAVHELQQLQAKVRPLLPRVTVPVLVAHGAHDSTAHPGDARTLIDSVSSAEREILVFERSAHIVPVDHDGPALASAVARFLRGRGPASGSRERDETVFAESRAGD
jgi:carboxylesterase